MLTILFGLKMKYMQTFYLVVGENFGRSVHLHRRPWHKTSPTIFTEQTIKQNQIKYYYFFRFVFSFSLRFLAAAVRSYVGYELWGNTAHTCCFQSNEIFVCGATQRFPRFLCIIFVFGVDLWSEFARDVPISHTQINKMGAFSVHCAEQMSFLIFSIRGGQAIGGVWN